MTRKYAHKLFSALLIFTFSFSGLGPSLNSSAHAADDTASIRDASAGFEIKPMKISQDIKVRVSRASPDTELVLLPEQIITEVPAGLTPEQIAKDGLTAKEVAEFREIKRDILESTLRATLSPDFNGTGGTNGSDAYALVPKGGSVSVSYQAYNPITQTLTAPDVNGQAPTKKKLISRLVGFVKAMNEAIILSTYREFKNYRKAIKTNGKKMDEVGLSVNLKVELQIGIGGLSYAKTGALVLDLGYNRRDHAIMFRTGWRKEGLSGGMAFPAVKFEMRSYQLNSQAVADPKAKGHAWYPPAVPLVSLVLDSSDRYMAQGIVLSVNAGDLIPGGSFMNSVNEFEEIEQRRVLFKIPDRIFDFYNRAIKKLLGRPTSCAGVFS